MEKNQFPEQEDMMPLTPADPPEAQEIPVCVPEDGSQPLPPQESAELPGEEAPLNISLWADDPAFLELLVPDETGAEVKMGPAPQESQTEMLPGVEEDLPLESREIPNAEDSVPQEPSEEAEEAREEDAEEAEVPVDQELMEVSELLREEASDSRFQADPEDPAAFARSVAAKPEKPPIPSRSRPARKGRPRKRGGEGLFGIPNILVTGVWLALILLIGVTLGRMLWVCAADVLAFGREDKAVTVTIYESDTIDDITQKLNKAGLIRYPGLFKLYASFAVDEGEIRPGIWDLNTLYDYHALVKMMSPSSSREVVKLMIPEGYSSRQIFQLLEENKICTYKDVAAYAASGELDFYWFLDNVDRGEENCLEGFLFPDTYQFYTNDSPRSVLQKMLDNFDYRFTEELRAKLPELNAHISQMMAKDGRDQAYIDSHQLTLRDMIIVASMIEKETSSAEEGHTIASVIYNRLYSWGTTPAYLNIDASMVYALGKTDITAEDLRIDHPYNTYLYTGLTPGPISNPGMSSIKAALEPSTTNYYYYVLDPAAGSHHFSTTYEEHQAFIAALGD